MVERGSGIAVWRQIGESLADDIRNKLYLAGEQLPSEPELAAKFAVNRHTIRRAMGELEQSGLIRIEQGRGTFVQEHAIDYAIGKRTRFSENLRSQGVLGHLETLGSQTLRAADIAKHLGLPRNARCCACIWRARPKTGPSARPNTTSTKALSRFRRTPDRAEIGVQGLCALRHRRLHAQMVAHHGGAALARSGAAAGPAEDAPYPAGRGAERGPARRALQYSITRFVGTWCS